jgi:hypothetical protein
MESPQVGVQQPAILPTRELAKQAVPDRFDAVALRPGVGPGQNSAHESHAETAAAPE